MSPSDGSLESLEGATVALFFTFGVSMRAWFEDGMIEREVAVYNRLATHAERIYLFTYGDEIDVEYADLLAENVEIVPKKYVSNDLLYSFLAPIIHFRTLREVDVVKTNQMLGSWTALLAKFLCGPALVVRTGYVLTVFYDELDKPLPIRFVASALEATSYFFADGVLTSSPFGYEYVEDRYVVRGDHLMLPNYIETDVFRPMAVPERPRSICYVGRLAEQKNLRSLIRAVAGTPYQLTLVGSGEIEPELRSLANDLDADVTFEGRVPNHDLPQFLNSHELFVLPSLFEGMPKSLLEAMSCGMAVVGTRVKGTQEVISHEHDGLLCEPSAESLRRAIERVLGDDTLRTKLGRNARETIVEQYSLDTIAATEATFHASVSERRDAVT